VVAALVLVVEAFVVDVVEAFVDVVAAFVVLVATVAPVLIETLYAETEKTALEPVEVNQL
jgi:hypothetical protein